MYGSGELQRWAGRICLLLVAVFGMLGFHYANVRFVPLMAGFAIMAGVCYLPRGAPHEARSIRDSGQRPAI
jgi:hypothetical protein